MLSIAKLKLEISHADPFLGTAQQFKSRHSFREKERTIVELF